MKTKSLIMTYLLIIALVFSSYPVSAQGDTIQNNGGTVNITNVFNDIKVDNWAYQAVSDMSKRGVISGYKDGSFKPQDSISREEFATLISKTFNLDLSVTQDVYFSDIAVDRWSYKYIAASKDYLTGYYPPKGKAFFDPEAKASREDVAVALVKALNLSTSSSSMGANFKDYNQISPGLRKYIDTATTNNLISGYEDGTFRPQEPVSRAEAAMLLYRSIKNTIGDRTNVSVSQSTYQPSPTSSPDSSLDQSTTVKPPDLWADIIRIPGDPVTVRITGETTPKSQIYIDGVKIEVDYNGKFHVDKQINKEGTYQYIIKSNYFNKETTITKSIDVAIDAPQIFLYDPKPEVQSGNPQIYIFFNLIDINDNHPILYVNNQKRSYNGGYYQGDGLEVNLTQNGVNDFAFKLVNKYGKESNTVTKSVYYQN